MSKYTNVVVTVYEDLSETELTEEEQYRYGAWLESKLEEEYPELSVYWENSAHSLDEKVVFEDAAGLSFEEQEDLKTDIAASMADLWNNCPWYSDDGENRIK